VTSESILLLAKIPSIDSMVVYIDKLFVEITEIVGQIDPVVVSKIYGYLQTLLSQLVNITIKVLNTVLSAVLSLPSVLLIAVITFIATYLFSKDLKVFSGRFYSVFSTEGKSKMENIIKEGISMTIGYAKAYSLVVFITFVQVLVGFSLLKIDFAVILSIICALFDILPVIGMIIIFIPLIIYNFVIGESFVAIGLIVLFLVVTVVRQIIEPKIVSQTLDIHPLMILAAIFIGLKVSGFVGMIYFIALLVGYKVLTKVKVL
jgi:sporulation integral membrane protein YtvI